MKQNSSKKDSSHVPKAGSPNGDADIFEVGGESQNDKLDSKSLEAQNLRDRAT